MLLRMLLKALMPVGLSFSFSGDDQPETQSAPGLLSDDQRQQIINQIFGRSGELAETGAAGFFQPSFEFAQQVVDPLTGLAGPALDAALRQSREQFDVGTQNFDQLLQQQGAFFSGDRGTLQERRFGRQQQLEGDIFASTAFNLGQLGVGFTQNLIGQGIQGTQTGLTFLDRLLGRQQQGEQFNVGQANQVAINQQPQGGPFDFLSGFGAGGGAQNFLPTNKTADSTGGTSGGQGAVEADSSGFLGGNSNFSDAAKIATIVAQLGLSLCWVASELYGGWFEPKTNLARFYINFMADKKFKQFYIDNGKAIAGYIKNKDDVKGRLRPLFDNMVNKAAQFIAGE